MRVEASVATHIPAHLRVSPRISAWHLRDLALHLRPAHRQAEALHLGRRLVPRLRRRRQLRAELLAAPLRLDELLLQSRRLRPRPIERGRLVRVRARLRFRFRVRVRGRVRVGARVRVRVGARVRVRVRVRAACSASCAARRSAWLTVETSSRSSAFEWSVASASASCTFWSARRAASSSLSRSSFSRLGLGLG